MEIGSHYGAFLQVAGEWGWRAEGVDPGKDTSGFARSKGFKVHVAALDECRFNPQTFDGIFIWNCFEQMEDPDPTLVACRRFLKTDGLLTVRTPNGFFYSLCETLLKDKGLAQPSKDFVLRAMGYNNLLGFPYLYGHSTRTLKQLIGPYGFVECGALNSELIEFPLLESPRWVDREEEEITERLRLLERLSFDRPGGNAHSTLDRSLVSGGLTRDTAHVVQNGKACSSSRRLRRKNWLSFWAMPRRTRKPFK